MLEHPESPHHDLCRASLEGLGVSSSGTYDILNALVSSNGNLRVVVDDKTRVVPAAKGVGAAEASAAEV